MSDLKHLPSHPEVREAVKRPIVFVAGTERSVIPKDAVLCDFCNAVVAVEETDEDVPDGYALLCEDGCHVTHVVCEDCKEAVE